MELIVTKWIALEGTVKLVREKRQALRKRFSAAMLQDAEAFETDISTEKEQNAAAAFGAAAIYPLGEGGILNGLWYLMEEAHTGMEVDLRKIPIRQETVEICEFFDLNPYYMASKGALLILTDNGSQMVRKLEHEGIPAAAIGGTTAGNDRILYNQGNKRYLDRPQKEELAKIFGKEGRV